MLNDWIGMTAGILTTIAFLPQVMQVLKTKSTDDISLVMYITFIMGIVFWLAYGVLLGAWPVIIANIITFILALVVLVMKLKHG